MEDRVISLRKDRVISLTKTGNSDGVKVPFIFTGLSWGPIYRGRVVRKVRKTIHTGNFFQRIFGLSPTELVEEEIVDNEGSREDVDLDSSILMYNSNKSLIETVYFGKKTSIDRSIFHYGDDTTGSNKKGKKDNEVIRINLKEVNSNCNYIVVILNSYTHHKFDEIPYINMRIYGNKSEDENDMGEVLASYQIDNSPEFKGKESLVLGVFYRTKEHWDFKACGITTKERSIESISKGSARKAIDSL